MTTAPARPAANHQTPTKRFIVIGASNVARGFPILVDSARRLLGSSLDILGAYGHGRSYGLRKGIFGQKLPAIVECGLWQALGNRPVLPTVALMTDIGNDLLYDVPVPQLVGWIETCLDRLGQAGAEVVLASLPRCSVGTLSSRRFLLLRTLYFPRCRLGYSSLMERVSELDERLRAGAEQRGIRIVEHCTDWYGFDPIHIQRKHYEAVWCEWLGNHSGRSRPDPVPATSFWSRLHLRLLQPERRWLLGWERRQEQPATQMPDGTIISQY